MNSNIFCDNIVDLWFKDTNTPGFWFELKKKNVGCSIGFMDMHIVSLLSSF